MTDRRVKRWPVVAAVGLCITGVALSGVLLARHAVGESRGGWLGSVCGKGGGCDKVAASRWGVFPPRPEAAPATPEAPEASASGEPGSAAPGGMPVAALGLFYFSALLVWLAAVGVPNWKRKWMYSIVLAACTAGCAGSVWFIAVMAAFVKAWCLLCVGAHAANFGLLAVLAVFRRRLLAVEAPAAAPERSAGALLPEPPYPGTRLAAVVVALMVAVCAAEWGMYRAYALQRVSDELAKLAQSAQSLEMAYFREKKREIEIRKDDPIQPPGEGLYATIVLFSDIECPACSKFDRLLFEKIVPLYNGHLRVVFKHFPLSELHPNAKRAAWALEAARVQGKFWEMHDVLIAHRLELGTVKMSELAKEAGLDVLRFLKDMYSSEASRRVNEDIRLAVSLGVDATPAVFLNGRRVDKVIRNLMGFWKRRAESLRQSREARGQKW